MPACMYLLPSNRVPTRTKNNFDKDCQLNLWGGNPICLSFNACKYIYSYITYTYHLTLNSLAKVKQNRKNFVEVYAAPAY